MTTNMSIWIIGVLVLIVSVSGDDNVTDVSSSSDTPAVSGASTVNESSTVSDTPTVSTSEAAEATTVNSSSTEVPSEGTTPFNVSSTPEVTGFTEVSTDSNISSTQQPGTTPMTPCHPGQHFDAPSFIGGIVLALGVMAILLFGWKFYKSKTNHRYSQF